MNGEVAPHPAPSLRDGVTFPSGWGRQAPEGLQKPDPAATLL